MTLIQLLSASPQNTDQVQMQEINNQLLQMTSTPQFYQECIAILLNPEISQGIKLNAMGVFHRLGIKQFWRQFDPQLKNAILSQIPSILVSTLTMPLCETLSDDIISLAIPSGEWPDFYPILLQLFEKDDNYLRAALILAKSMCKLIKNPDYVQSPLYPQSVKVHEEFSQLILPILTKICSEVNDFSILNYTYHCLSRILYASTAVRVNALTQYGEIYFQRFMTISTQFQHPEDPAYLHFLREGIKFLQVVSYNSKDPTSCLTFNQEQLTAIFQFINVLFSFPECKYEKSRSIGILNNIIIKREQYQILEQNAQAFIGLFCSNMAPSEDEIKKMEDDPCSYNDENQLCYATFDEIRSSICRFLTSYVKSVEETQIPPSLYQFASSAIESNDPAQIYVSLRLLTTSITPRYQQFFAQFLPQLIQVSSHSHFVIRASAFLCMTAIERGCAIPPNLIEVCIQHFDDSHKIVAFYAILALKQIMYVIRKQADYEATKAYYAEQIPIIFQKYFELANEFHDTEISEGLNIFIEFFDEKILPSCEVIFPAILNLFAAIQAASSDDKGNANTEFLADALILIIKRIEENPEIAQTLLPTFYQQLFMVFQAITINDDYLRVIEAIINASPHFDPNSWGIVEPLIQIIGDDSDVDLDNVLAIIEQLIYRDTELESKPEIIAQLCELLMHPDVIASDSSVWASFIMRCGHSIPIMPQLLQTLISTQEDAEFSLDVCNIFSAIAYKFDKYPQELIPIWKEYHYFPLYVGSMLKIFNDFQGNPELQADLIENAFDSILNSDEEIGSDDDDEILANFDRFQIRAGDFHIVKSQTPQWFDQKALVEQFANLIMTLQNSNSPVFQLLTQRLPDLQEKIEMLAKFEPQE